MECIMTVLFFEGFETVGTELGLANQSSTRPRIEERWAATASGTTKSTDSFYLVDDAFGEGFGINMGTGNSNNNVVRYDIPEVHRVAPGASAPEFVMGVLCHVPSLTKTWTMFDIDAEFGNELYSNQVNFIIENSRNIKVDRAPSATEIARANDVIRPGRWQYIELHFKAGNTNDGEIIARVDGVEVINAVTVDTNNNNSHSGFSRLLLRNANGSDLTPNNDEWCGYDDFYILVNDASGQEGFLGPQRVRSLPPDGDSGTMNWTTSTGTSHYVLVDENGVDTADYVESATNLDVDMFTLTNRNTTTMVGNYNAVKIEAEHQNTSTGTPTLDIRIDSNGTVEETNVNVDNTGYDVDFHLADKDPSGGADFTAARIDGLLGGLEINSGF
jgi:hypothetical protein